VTLYTVVLVGVNVSFPLGSVVFDHEAEQEVAFFAAQLTATESPLVIDGLDADIFIDGFGIVAKSAWSGTRATTGGGETHVVEVFTHDPHTGAPY
jgi:hypothetical protein